MLQPGRGFSVVLEPVKLFVFSFQGGFAERCAQCSEVNWGLTDGGRFYCRTCHNVIEVKSGAVGLQIALF